MSLRLPLRVWDLATAPFPPTCRPVQFLGLRPTARGHRPRFLSALRNALRRVNVRCAVRQAR